MEAALLDIDDVKLVVVFVDRAPSAAAYAALERAVAQAGFQGEIVAAWPDQFGRTQFFARPELHAFLQAVDYDQLRAQIDIKLELP